jgi:LysM repeat protein
VPGGRNHYDEQKDTHFLQGKRRQQSMDYRGAVEAFEKAIEANPKSASAHFELGLLFAEELNKDVIESDKRDLHHATAIYHLEKFLEISPQSPLADRVQQQITACKLELAKTVSFTLLSSAVHKELERLNATNAVLRQQTEQLKLRVAQQAHVFSNQFATLHSQYLVALSAATNRTETASSDASAQFVDRVTERSGSSGNDLKQTRPSDRHNSSRSAAAPLRNSAVVLPSSNNHIVRPGDTLASIARTHKLTLNALTAANPGVEPRRLRVGQTLRIPASSSR